ncbi:exopolyphosphatase [Stieleria sp. JC731]|uniref:exopolyphosphatase n=1 Tax=Pirellulaceae TaxID=2691357 RepID=UPI001E52BA10|nr:exopolyphosphatase [Stieleria sp. JC731]MCC9603161.1 exopolyphosphatase [Stieleria sp. JC731]
MTDTNQKYRLLTRSDFDGLVCALLLKELDILGDIKFVHPKDMQDGVVEVTENDILTNLPYVPGCHLCFDHHSSEELRNEGIQPDNYVLSTNADSAARVVYDHFGGRERFPAISEEMMTAVDKADAAKFSADEIKNPQGWPLLSFLMDARTGLGRFHTFRVSNYQLMMDLIDCCRDLDIEDILLLPDVRERVELYREHQQLAVNQIKECASVHGNLVMLDLRDEETIYATNRFTVYALYPQCNISIHVLWGKQKQNTVFTIGKSILDRSCTTDVGELCLKYGGGGHEAAGTCQVEHGDAERVSQELIDQINSDQQSAVPATV